MSRQRVHDLIAARRAEHLERVRAYMALPSVSASDPAGVRRAAQHLVECHRRMGCQVAELVETPGLPAVFARIDAGARRTLAVYGYIDTNAVGPGWTVEPYEGVVAARAPHGRVLYGRGAASKGGAIAFLNALEAIREVDGGLPVNLVFLAEGEEFLGSPHMAGLIDRFRSHLARADAVFWPGPSQAANGDVALYLGNKGLLKIELACSAERWGRGPLGGAAHSSTQGVLDHPAWRLVHALATLYDPGSGRILVEDFARGLRGPTPAEDALLDRLADLYRGREGEAVPGIAPRARAERFLNDISGRDVFLRYCFEPTMNIDGLRAGMTGPDTPAWTLPDRAYCTIDHRLPPGLDPSACLAALRRHLDGRGYPDIAIEVLGSVGPQSLALEHDLTRSLLAAFGASGAHPVVWPCRGTSGPTGHFHELLGLGAIGPAGIGHASGHSGPDEYLVIEGDGRVGGLLELERFFADLVYDYAERS